MKKVNLIEDIPSFSSEAEEAEFWETHGLGPDLLSQMKRRDELGEDDPELPTPRAPTEEGGLMPTSSFDEYVKEVESDPAEKAALDEARQRLRDEMDPPDDAEGAGVPRRTPPAGSGGAVSAEQED